MVRSASEDVYLLLVWAKVIRKVAAVQIVHHYFSEEELMVVLVQVVFTQILPLVVDVVKISHSPLFSSWILVISDFWSHWEPIGEEQALEAG